MRLIVFATAFVSVCACHRKEAYVEPPRRPVGSWANVGRVCTKYSPVTEIPSSDRDSLGDPFGETGKHNNPWEKRAEISRKIPGGWGGVTRKENGFGTRLLFVDTTQRIRAFEALAAAGSPFSPDTPVKPGRWTYAQIYDWFRYIHTHLRHAAVTMWTLDEANNRILYGVENEAAAREFDRQLAGMNVPCFLVARFVTGPARLL
jgi:hypothetical protein